MTLIDTKEKMEILKFNIGRYDHYYDAINNKGNVYLALMTFLLGGNVTAFFTVNNEASRGTLEWVLFALIVALQLAGIALTLLSLKPYLKSGAQWPGGSLFFFSDVSDMTLDEYSTQLDGSTSDSVYGDATRQTHQLATGLCYKYTLLNRATYIIGIQIAAMVLLGILIIC
jgi:hypothetical protein